MFDELKELIRALVGRTVCRVDASYNSEDGTVDMKEKGLQRFLVRDEKRRELVGVAESSARKHPNSNVEVRLTYHYGVDFITVDYS